jgi:hypothetical protein
MKITVFWDVAPYSLVEITLMMEAVITSETSVNFYETTLRSIPEDSRLHVDQIYFRQNRVYFRVL